MPEREYLYDAFISYRHNERDKAIAKALQKKMESYMPPKALRGEGFKKWRVFRDETELYTSEDLNSKIKEALEKSRYLIVICSEETKKSPWCIKEIQYFKELHEGKNDRIITVLAEGEPDEVFPKELLSEIEIITDESGNSIRTEKRVEPMAANLVASDRRKTVKRLNKEFLRIATPMLGCTYDQLYNRTQRRKLQRIIAAALSVISVLLVFLLVVGSLYLRLKATNRELVATQAELEDEQLNLKVAMASLMKKTQEAEKNLQLAVENGEKANKNATEAEKQRAIAVDNAKKAERNARETQRKNIEILTSQAELYLENQDYTKAVETALSVIESNPAAERVLAEATGAYSTAVKYNTASAELDDVVEEIYLSEDGSRLAAVAGNYLYVIDTRDGKVIKKLDMDKLLTKNTFSDFSTERDIYIEGNSLYVLANHQLVRVDMDRAEIKWHFNKEQEERLLAEDIITNDDAETVFLNYANWYTVVGKDGRLLQRVNAKEIHNTEFYAHKENTKMDSRGNIYIADSASGRLIRINIENEKVESVPLEWNSHDYKVVSVAVNDESFFVNCYPYSLQAVQTEGKLFCYDKESLEEKWVKEYNCGTDTGTHALHLYKGTEGEETVVACVGRGVVRFDAKTGNVKKMVSYDAWPGVIDFNMTHDGYELFYENEVRKISLDTDKSITKLKLDTGVEIVTRSEELAALCHGGFVVAESASSKIDIYTEAVENERTVAFIDEVGVGSVAHNGNGILAIDNYTYKNGARSDEVVLYDAVKGRLISKTFMKVDANNVQMALCDNNHLFITNGKGKVVILDSKGNILFEADIEDTVKKACPEEDNVSLSAFDVYTEGNIVVYCTNGGRIFFDTDSLKSRVEWNRDAYFDNYIAKNKRSVYTATFYQQKKEGVFYNDGKAERFIFECDEADVLALALSEDGRKAAFCVKDGYTGLYDGQAKSMKKIPSVYKESEARLVKFSPDGESLVVMYDNARLVNYSAKGGEAVAISDMLKEYASISRVEFIDEKTLAVVGSSVGGMHILDLDTMQEKAFVEGGFHYIDSADKIFCEQENKGILFDYLDTDELTEYAKRFIAK